MPHYDYVLMDVDNTLLDFDGAEDAALRETLGFYGYPLTEETLRAYHRVNRGLWDAFERGEITQADILSRRFLGFMEAMGGNHDPIGMNGSYMDRLAQQGSLLPGAEAFCRSLAPHCTLAIVTNGISAVQRGRLEACCLPSLFREIFISAELGYQKPQREFFDKVFLKLGIKDTKRVVIFGDSLSSDIQGGIQAGIDTMWYNPKGLPCGSICPTFEVSSYEEARSLILGE